MSQKTRSSVVLLAFAAGIGIIFTACEGTTAPRLVQGRRAVSDSSDTTSCPYGWSIMNGVVTCNGDGQ